MRPEIISHDVLEIKDFVNLSTTDLAVYSARNSN
jgi:hypothetical protein